MSEFTREELENLVRQSITRGIGSCQLDREARAQQQIRPGSSLAYKIDSITSSIEGTLDCNKLQQEVQTVLDSIKAQIEDATEYIAKKLAESLGLVAVPLNPFKIPKYIVKLVLNLILPDLEATIDFIKRTIELVNAITKLIATIDKVIDRLEACAFSTVMLVTDAARNEIDEGINEFKLSVSDAIGDAICNGLKESGITANNLDDVFTAIGKINDLKTNLTLLEQTTKVALGNSVAKIESSQADIQTLTGIPSVLDTSSGLDNFLVSVDSPEYAQYLADVRAITDAPELVSNVAPFITSINPPAVGNTVTCSNGIWTANDVVVSNGYTLEFQWMRQGQEIFGANTYTYVPSLDDIEYPLYCRVRAVNQTNFEEVFTASTNTVVYAMASPPTISGNAVNNTLIFCVGGDWPFTPTSLLYEWVRVEQAPEVNTIVQPLSSNNYYLIKALDVTKSIKCRVVAQSFRYTVSAETANTAIVIP